MREVMLRKSRIYKVYVAVFVCFSIQAVHLEVLVVTELSKNAFLAAFDKFIDVVCCRIYFQTVGQILSAQISNITEDNQ